VTSCVANAGFNADKVWMSVTDWTNTATPERQDKVILALALAYFTNGIGKERLVGVIVHVELEEGFAPVMRAVGLLKVIVGQYANVFRASKNTILMPVVDDFVTSVGHHLPELNYLLRVCTSVKLFAGNCVR
jgi:hypothetical protein